MQIPYLRIYGLTEQHFALVYVDYAHLRCLAV